MSHPAPPAADAPLGDDIVRAYFQRRAMPVGLDAGFWMIGSRFSPDSRRLREFACRNRLPYRFVDLEQDRDGERMLRAAGVPPGDTPLVIWFGGLVLRNPSNSELARALGLPAARPGAPIRDVLVVGAGPAGLAAAVHAAAEGLTTTVLDAVGTGGQAGDSSRVENHLGFPDGISGRELADRAVVQANRLGAEISVPATALALRPDGDLHVVRYDPGGLPREIVSRTVVIATGARYNGLDIAGTDATGTDPTGADLTGADLTGIERFERAGVHYAATLVEARLCGGRPVAVVGGGDSAGQATLLLADVATEVYLVVREDEPGERMSRYLVDRISRHPRVVVLAHTEVAGVVGDGTLREVVVRENHSGARGTLPAQALFILTGARPNTGWLAGAVALDADGFVLTGHDAGRATDRDPPPQVLETSRPGVFAVGDVRVGAVRRVASAVADGATAIRLLHEHLARTGSPVS
ncbi:NAD(P)/FAD-dependent oxidoreductase [Frankia sp. Mgl5]|uniref:NAD(P)/FAD-dependent oxidoreductase n=1 Tax=Frankia sp. Mgl5 TaxID=2933793 RepID=UPI00200BA8D9|nr:FAD-dependent oxidoreductase [Frankia sp. Mgl5]MCK9928658.1 NAD(P)/FAD-dependent oxidoreductase [Frankia sp. Mgl5]